MNTRCLLKSTRAASLVAIAAVGASACATNNGNYPYTHAELKQHADHAKMERVLLCNENVDRLEFDRLMTQLQAKRAVHSVDAKEWMYRPNVDYLFPRGMTLLGLPVESVSARTENIQAGPARTGYRHRYTSYGVLFEPSVPVDEVTKRLQIKHENIHGHPQQRRGWFNRHTLTIRPESGRDTLNCGYKTNTVLRYLKDKS